MDWAKIAKRPYFNAHLLRHKIKWANFHWHHGSDRKRNNSVDKIQASWTNCSTKILKSTILVLVNYRTLEYSCKKPRQLDYMALRAERIACFGHSRILARCINRENMWVEPLYRAFRGHINGKILNFFWWTDQRGLNIRQKKGVDEWVRRAYSRISFLYIELGEAARRTLLDRKPNMDIKTMNLNDSMKKCQDAFQKKRNKLMDRHKFLNSKPMEGDIMFGTR